MAEPASIAFGRYLRTLRERKGYSLDEVSDLSRTFADPLDKAYLSRCENGRLKIAFSKVIALSRIYEVPAEVLLERLELDLELEKQAPGPDTDQPFAHLVTSGTECARRGSNWSAYAHFRDALAVANTDPLMAGFASRSEQVLCSVMNCSTTARVLGRPAFCAYELAHIEKHQSALSDEYRASLYSNLTASYRSLGKLKEAVEFADRAIEVLKETPSQRYLGGAYVNRANLAQQYGEHERAIELYRRADRLLADHGRVAERPKVLLNLAETYLSVRRSAAARKAIQGARRLAETLGQQKAVARSMLLEGDLEDLAGRTVSAEARWLDAITCAKQLKDRVLRFQAEFRLFRSALLSGDRNRARLIQRRIDRSVIWLPAHIDELEHFKSLRQTLATTQVPT